MAAPLFLVAMSGCKFEPGGLQPGEGPEDGGGTPVDGAPVPVDGRPGIDSSVTMDSGTEIDGSLPLPPDAQVNNQRRKQITILASRVEAPGAVGTLDDFPVLFSVVDQQLADRASADGSDIYFVDGLTLARLQHEIEKWDPDTGELVAWVRIPALSGLLDTVIYIHYGDPELAQPGNPRQVWSSDFSAVWHLAQDPGPGGAGDIVDSTTGNDGTAHDSMQAGDLVAGQIGAAIDFDGSDDEITFTNPLSGGTSHTISAWVNQRSTNNDDAIVVLGNGAMNQARWLYGARAGDEVAFGFYTNDHISSINIENDGWRLLHWTYDGSTSRLYINGAQQGGSVTSGTVNTQGNTGWIGNVSDTDFGTNMNLNGQIDEVRIAAAVRTAEWIETEFNNQSNPSTFYTVGPETDVP